VLGYTYPEFQNNPSAASIKTVINNLYSSDCMVGPPKAQVQNPKAPRSAITQTRSLLALSNNIANLTTDSGALHEYIANIHVDPTPLDSSFKLYLFDGPVSDDSSTWMQTPSLLGYHYFMVNPKTGAQRTKTRFVAGAITLTSTLIGRVQRGLLSGMSNGEVEGYLSNKLVWKGVKVCFSLIVFAPVSSNSVTNFRRIDGRDRSRCCKHYRTFGFGGYV
jgi:hypothetical protein